MEENNKQQPEQDMQESVNEETKEQGTPLRSSIIMLLAAVGDSLRQELVS